MTDQSYQATDQINVPKAQTAHQHIRTVQIGTGWFPEKPGGLARVFYDNFKHFKEADITAKGLVTGSPNVDIETAHQITAFAPSDASLATRWLRARRAFQKLLRQDPPDLLVSHFAFYTFPLLNMMQRYPLVVHFHGPWASESAVEHSSPLSVQAKKYLEASVYKRASQFIVLSQAFKKVLHETYNVPEEQIHIVPGGIDATAYDTGLSRQEAREKLGWPQNRPIVLAVRRLVRRQGLENLVTAMREVTKAHPQALLYIAGQGALRSALEAQIQQLGLQDNVKLLGYVPDELLSTTYRGADFSVVPTVALEGFGLITIESLASGTPVLVTPIGGLPEAVRNLSEALILPGSTVPDLVEGVSTALTGTRILPDSTTCQRYVRENFDHSHIIQKTRQVYELALGLR